MAAQHDRWILCGGLATGKTQVRRLLEEAGVPTIDADSVGHKVLEPGGPAFDAVAARWPSVVVEGRIDRRALAGVVFEDSTQLAELESITHPIIFDRIRPQVEGIAGAAVVEMPILSDRMGAGWGRIVVDSRDEARLHRAVERGMTVTDARARIASQPSRKRWLAAADVVIPNHGSREALVETVTVIVDTLRMPSKRQ